MMIHGEIAGEINKQTAQTTEIRIVQMVPILPIYQI